ncbi:hypothetical protein BR141012304_20879 [Brucella inopinata]|nr:hypothetical protein BR141012304_20879 [Brucella inopinata]
MLVRGTDNSALAEMAEIAENLHRREITALERTELQARWVEITSRDKPREVRAVSSGERGKRGGVKQAARDLNLPETNLHQSVRIASLSDDAKAGTPAEHVPFDRELSPSGAQFPSRWRTISKQQKAPDQNPGLPI